MRRYYHALLFLFLTVGIVYPLDIHRALELGYLDRAKDMIIENPVVVKEKDKNGFTPLHRVANFGSDIRKYLWRDYRVLANLLVANGADPNAKDNLGATPLHWCAQDGFVPMASLLIARGANPSIRDKNGLLPIHWACREGNREMVLFLAPYSPKIYKVTLLGSPKDIEKLLEDSLYLINGQDRIGFTLLHWAVIGGKISAVRTLLEEGFDPNIPDSNGWTPLFWALYEKDRRISNLLINEGADVNVFDKGGWHLLHHAIITGSIPLVKKILSQGIDINIRTKLEGLTPLHLAVMEGDEDMVLFLLSSGANVNAKSKVGRSALSIAQKMRDFNIIQTLKSYGAK